MERKYLAHFIDASMNGTTKNYVRLGKDLEELNQELNPDVEQKKNILGENSVQHNGYEVSSEIEPLYYTTDTGTDNTALSTVLRDIAMNRKTGSACKTTMVDVWLNEDGTVDTAFRENVTIVPTSVGGDTSGIQIPFTVYYEGGRVEGTWDMSTKTFTPPSTNG